MKWEGSNVKMRVKALDNMLFGGRHVRAGATFEVSDYQYSKIKDSVEVIEVPKPVWKSNVKLEPLVFMPNTAETPKAERILTFDSKVGVKKSGRT